MGKGQGRDGERVLQFGFGAGHTFITVFVFWLCNPNLHIMYMAVFFSAKKKCAGRPSPPPTTFRVYWCIHRTSILEVWRLPVQLLEL